MQTLAATRRYWLPQLASLLLLAMIGTLPFWLTDLDLRIAAQFQHPGQDDPWPGAREAPWLFLYQAAPLLVGLMAFGCLATLAASTIWPSLGELRPRAVFLLATVLIGPGLIVNVFFKDHWGRPRPHQTYQLGGSQAYLPPLAMGQPGRGKSFPCGHGSAGYLLGAFFPIWLRRRPRLATLALLGSIVLGTLMGVGRMVAGDHFLSDVIWSAVIVYGTALALYYFVMRIPRLEALQARNPPPPRSLKHPMVSAASYGIGASIIALAVLMSTPVHESRLHEVIPARFDPVPRTLRVIADDARIRLAWHDSERHSATILLKGRGFGLPGARLRDALSLEDGILTLRVAHRGVFTEKDSSLIVDAVARDWDRIEIQTQSGDIRVQPLPAAAPKLELVAHAGQVLHDSR